MRAEEGIVSCTPPFSRYGYNVFSSCLNHNSCPYKYTRPYDRGFYANNWPEHHQQDKVLLPENQQQPENQLHPEQQQAEKQFQPEHNLQPEHNFNHADQFQHENFYQLENQYQPPETKAFHYPFCSYYRGNPHSQYWNQWNNDQYARSLNTTSQNATNGNSAFQPVRVAQESNRGQMHIPSNLNQPVVAGSSGLQQIPIHKVSQQSQTGEQLIPGQQLVHGHQRHHCQIPNQRLLLHQHQHVVKTICISGEENRAAAVENQGNLPTASSHNPMDLGDGSMKGTSKSSRLSPRYRFRKTLTLRSYDKKNMK